MSLRRPRIKSAVNLSALANGRLQRKAPDPEEKAVCDQKDGEQVEKVVTNDQASDVTERKKGIEVEIREEDKASGVASRSGEHLSAITNDQMCNKVSDNITNNVDQNYKVTETEQNDQISCSESKESHRDAKFVLENNTSPFSPPPARPAPVSRFKPRFRPNLNENRNRIRRYSGTLMDLGSPPPCHGSPMKKHRTISCSSASETDTDFEPATQDEILMKRPPPIQRMAVLNEVSSPPPPPSLAPTEKQPKPSPDSEPKASGPIMVAPRQRRITEARDSIESLENRDPTVFEIRKADHKKKFTTGIPERTQITMFDLIYYNPSTGTRMSNSSSLRSSRANSRASSIDVVVRDEAAQLEMVRKRLEEEAVDDVAPVDAADDNNIAGNSDNNDEEAMPVPQVMVGPDGSIIIDESTTLIETTAAKKAKDDFLKSPLVFENANRATNYGSWVKRKKTVDWTNKETVRFFKALSIFGTDFSMMENIFKRRTRHELKMKYKKEEKQNRALVDKCLTQGLQFDASIMESEEEEEAEPATTQVQAKAQKRRRSSEAKPKKKRPRRVKQKRGYYASSDEAEVEDEVYSEAGDARSLATQSRRIESIDEVLAKGINVLNYAPSSPVKSAPKPVTQLVRTPTNEALAHKFIQSPRSVPISPPTRIEHSPAPSLLKSLLAKTVASQNISQLPSPSAGFAFPPALLAANPSLANAAPGSLVVVASPSSSSNPGSQILQVFVLGGPVHAASPSSNVRVATDDPAAAIQVPEKLAAENTLDMSAAGRVRTFSGTNHS